jgi:hypothetical protein
MQLYRLPRQNRSRPAADGPRLLEKKGYIHRLKGANSGSTWRGFSTRSIRPYVPDARLNCHFEMATELHALNPRAKEKNRSSDWD